MRSLPPAAWSDFTQLETYTTASALPSEELSKGLLHMAGDVIEEVEICSALRGFTLHPLTVMDEEKSRAFALASI